MPDPEPTPTPAPDPAPTPDPPKPADELKPDPARDGYPADTPVAEMSVQEQANYWRAQSKRHEARAKANKVPDDYDETKRQLESLKRASQSDHEREIDQARETAKAEGRKAAAPQIIAAEFRAAGVPADQISDIVAPLNNDYFLNDDGTVDTDKVAAFAEKFKPVTGDPQRRGPSTGGQGTRTTPGDHHSVAAGAELWNSRNPSRATT